jgi:ribose transport system substrate-binding protein
MNDRKWTLALAAIGLVFLYLLGRFGYSYFQIAGIVSDLADTGRSQANLRHHVVMISQELDNPFWRTVGQAAEEAAKEYNMELEYTGPFRLNPAEQTKLLDKAIASKVDGIFAQGVNGQDYTNLINKAMERGIPVITVDTDAPESKRLTYVGTDNLSSGGKLGEIVTQSAAKLGIQPVNIGIIIGSLEAPNQQLRLEGFENVVKTAPGFHIAGVAVSNISRIQATQAAEQLLRQHPEINVMVGTSALDGVGILQAVKTLNLQQKVRIYAFDDLDETKQAIARGEIEATVIQRPSEMGREAVRQLHMYFEGGTLLRNHFTSYDVLDRTNVGEVPPP